MEYHPGWEKTKARFEALWQGEIVDRCCAAVIAPMGDTSKSRRLPANPEDLVRFRTDGEWVLKRNLDIIEKTYFAGDAVPMIVPDIGAAGHASFFRGAKYHLENTVWYFPSIEEWALDSILFDKDSFLLQKTMELTQYLVEESKGRFFVAMPDISGNLDALAHLRGSENLLVDILVDPEPVKEALDTIQKVWKQTIDQLYDMVRLTNQGGSCVGWLYTWAPGLHCQMSSDISAMLSPEAFHEFVYPELLEQSEHLDFPLYHMDGSEQTRHLESLCSIEKLKMIQWTHVAGQPSPVHFIPVFRKIQAAGKNLLLQTNPRDMEILMENLSSKGLYLVIQAQNKEEADFVINRVAQLTRD
ncbi:MAG: hypothetical protein ACOX25_02740 [Caldicoprobacterales bacterium]|jgi:hypothetical protein|nr:hypothetical protein [Clostridiales bacterium]